ncbi:hypothetical protein V2J09_013048 [Rumex salicifolius]
MGGCVSAQIGCVGSESKKKNSRKKNKPSSRRRRGGAIRRRVCSGVSDTSSLDAHNNRNNNNNKRSARPSTERSFTNPTFQGSSEEAWFDSMPVFESEYDEDFHSVPDGNAHYSISECGRSSTEAKQPVFLDDIASSTDENAGKDERMLDNCGIIPSNCLPCIASTVPSIEKRSSSPTSARKKAALKHSFKWKDAHANLALFSSKRLLHRPIAGSQVQYCPIDKSMLDSWSEVEPGSFRVRTRNYFKDKKKDFAPNCAAYNPFGVDVFLCPRKIDHIARFVELPAMNSSGNFPPILVVNAQIPLYPATIFQGEADGEGLSIVLYFKLNESFSKELPLHFQESLRSSNFTPSLVQQRLMDDEVEKVKGFAVDTIAPFRERLKILGRISNMDDLPLSAAERKLMTAYNEKPVLSRPQHEFYSVENYFEIDLDMHRFGYISRKGFAAFLDRLKGNKAEELPEQILCCIRLNGIDYANYQQLGHNHLHI